MLSKNWLKGYFLKSDENVVKKWLKCFYEVINLL